MASVSLERVSKSVPGADILRDLSLEIADGEFLSLVGPSGCGKSTTLNLIAGLDEPTSGAIRIGGRQVNGLPPAERDLAMVFQSYALYPHKDVRKNLAFPLEIARLPRAEIDQRIAETAEMLGLSSLLGRKPQLYLLDEPLSNLDANLRTQMRAELKRLHRQLRATFVYVTHDQAEAMTLSDRIAVLRAGELQQTGSPREIYQRPRNRFVAEFFGTPRINVVPPGVVGLAGEGTAGVRPEHLEVLSAPAPGALEGIVELAELTGADIWVTAKVAGETLSARAPASAVLAQGDRAWLRIAGEVLRFDAAGNAQ